jgi:hypothetical protein
MGMILEGRALTGEQVEAVSTDSTKIEDLLFVDDRGDGSPDESIVDLDKSWHGLDFLLNGADTATPLRLAILGGRPVGADNGHGPARLLEAGEVRVVAAALAAVDTEQLRQRYDPLEFEKQVIYPAGIWAADTFDDYLLPNLNRLKDFYAAAAGSGAAVVLALT